MKIAVLGILAQKISKDALGGTEIFTANLVDELTLRGHEVTLFATEDSEVEAKVEGKYTSEYFCNIDKPTTFVRRSIVMHTAMYVDFLKKQDEFDFVHVSTAEWYDFLPFTDLLKIPHCITVHNRILTNNDLEKLFFRYPNVNLVFTQNSQLNSYPKSNKFTVIHHGVDLSDYKYNENPKDYLSWVGRLVPDKGLEKISSIQEKSGKEIKFGGGGEKSEFFQNQIMPEIKENKNITYLGSLNNFEKVNLLKDSFIFINPRIMKPSGGMAGYTVIEANACGTPVVGFDSEGMREVIKDGLNGFLARSGDDDELIKLIEKIFSMNRDDYKDLRRNSRKLVEEKFDLKIMVDKYENLYKELVKEYNGQN